LTALKRLQQTTQIADVIDTCVLQKTAGKNGCGWEKNEVFADNKKVFTETDKSQT